MDIWSILGDIYYAIQAGVEWVYQQLLALYRWVYAALVEVGQTFVAIANSFVWFGKQLWRGLTALRHLHFGSIWSAIKRAYNRLVRAFDWWRRRILEPLDRLRRQIWQIYRRFFKPLLMFLDSLRVFTRMMAVFNRKLAARLDHYLMGLETKLMYPITALLRRVNEISSYFTALITTAGRLARPLLLESLRRDALLVWEVLTNPRQAIYSPPERVTPRTLPQLSRDFREYAESGTGIFAELEPGWLHDFEMIASDLE